MTVPPLFDSVNQNEYVSRNESEVASLMAEMRPASKTMKGLAPIETISNTMAEFGTNKRGWRCGDSRQSRLPDAAKGVGRETCSICDA